MIKKNSEQTQITNTKYERVNVIIQPIHIKMIIRN